MHARSLQTVFVAAILTTTALTGGMANAASLTEDSVPDTLNGLPLYEDSFDVGKAFLGVVPSDGPAPTSDIEFRLQGYILPGTWTSPGAFPGPILDGEPAPCEWAIISGGLYGEGGTLRVQGSELGPTSITILDSDSELQLEGCQTFTRTS